MPSPPKLFLKGSVVFITTRMQEGLPFVATEYMKLIIESCLARALQLCSVKLAHYIVMPNHIHLILVVKNPEDVPRFMDRFKTETSHAVNRLLGRRQRTVWCAGYDAPPILTVEDVIDKILYIYANASKDGLEDCIEKFPLPNSWEMFQEVISRETAVAEDIMQEVGREIAGEIRLALRSDAISFQPYSSESTNKEAPASGETKLQVGPQRDAQREVVEKEVLHIRRSTISKLPGFKLHVSAQKKVAQDLIASNSSELNPAILEKIRLEPNAWMDAFGITEKAAMNQHIMKRLREVEAEFRETRRVNGRERVIGAKVLRDRAINTPYTPKTFGRKSWCICRDVEYRKAFIGAAKELLNQGHDALNEWRRGNTHARYPLGLFPPNMPRLGNLILPITKDPPETLHPLPVAA